MPEERVSVVWSRPRFVSGFGVGGADGWDLDGLAMFDTDVLVRDGTLSLIKMGVDYSPARDSIVQRFDAIHV